LRAPLNAILGWSNILLGGKLDEHGTARAIETISRNARAQNQLIADLLDVSRIITGKLRFEAGAVNLKMVIEAALETVRPAAEAKGVELLLTLDPTLGKVSGDADRLQQVVWNLLTNAIKYTPCGGHIETRLEREGEHAAIIVRDFGEGISPDFLPYVFARFRQADGATTRKHGGLGLGLSIVRHLVEAHGGQVRVSSEGAGKGTTFIVTLPLIAVRGEDREAEPADTSNPQLPSPKTLEGLRVLVVDDEADVRELLRFVLTDSGAEIRTVASAAEALDLLRQWQPEVLVSDIGMPDVDGYEFLRQVRALPAEHGGRIPAVALTGYARPEDERRALAAGYQLFVPKPVDLPELEAAIARLTLKS
jgi:CheY-like chemotaxis protein/two-component sensor histidine kinase